MAKTRSRGKQAKCLACARLRSAKYRRTEAERIRAAQQRSRLKRAYGVTPAFIDGKPCAICGTTSFGKRRAHVDHDHATGKIRGVLCHRCNTGIGLLGPNLTKALLYLRASVA